MNKFYKQREETRACGVLMEKSILIAVILIAAAFLIGFYIGSNLAAQRVRTLESQLAQSAAQAESLANQRSQLQRWLSGNVTLLQETAGERDRLKRWLDGNVTYYEERLSNLEEQLEAANVTELMQEVEKLEKEKDQLQAWLTGNITSYEAQIASLDDQLSVLRQQMEIEVLGIYFSPKGGCANQVVNWINRANRTIHVLIYSFTLDSIGDALINAYKRGVEVKVVFEKDQITEYSEYQKMRAVGIEVRNDTNPEYMHDKVMIIDGMIVFTGSFNWSANAEEKNNENLIVIRSTRIAGVYEGEFERVWGQSV